MISVQLMTESPQQQVVISIYPDSLMIDGDRVKFDGLINQKLTKCTYQLNSANEKQQWSKRLNWDKEILCVGEFQQILPKTNQYAFDYRTYLINNRYQGQIFIHKIQKIKEKPITIKNFAHRFRAKAIQRVETYCKPKTSTLIGGLLFNYRQSDYYDQLSLFTDNGLLHLFSISGMHVYFFLGCIDYLFRRAHFSFLSQFVPFLLLSALLTMLFGLNISILRAILSYLSNWIIKETGLKVSKMDRFSGILFICLVIEPRALLQLSSQLSFGFSFLLLIVSSMDNKKRHPLLQAQVLPFLSAPLLFYLFYDWPLMGGTLTFLLMPLFDWFLLPLTTMMFFFCSIRWLNSILDSFISILFDLPNVFLSYLPKLKLIGGQPFLIGVVLSICLALLFYERRRYFYCFCALFLLPVLPQRFIPYEKVTFVDVGQGDCIVLQSRWNQEVYVIDTGGKLAFDRDSWQKKKENPGINYSLLPYLKGEGIQKIDALILTHGDTDHLGDAQQLIRSFSVKEVLVSKGSFDNHNFQKLKKAVSKDLIFREVEVGEYIGKEKKLQVLAPKSGKGENNDSLVLYATYASQRFLFTGDLEKSGEEKLMEQYPKLTVDILKVGHHGSKTSSSQKFIKQLALKEAVISCGRKNRYKHPHQETLQTLRDNSVLIHRTDQEGMIQYKKSLKLERTTVLKY